MLAKLNLGKQGTDLCSSPVTQLFVAAYFAERDWREYLGQLKQLYRRRRDVMLEALTEHFGGRATWTRPDGGLFIWATLGGGVDTTDLLARAEGVAFVPGRAAYMDGRSGASSMRLNFAGMPEELIREGIRRIGATMGGDTGLFGALSGSPSSGSPSATPTPDADKEARTAATGSADESAGTLADVLELPLPEHQSKGGAAGQ